MDLLHPGQYFRSDPGLSARGCDGDTLVVYSMNSLARNLNDLRGLVPQLSGRLVRIEFVKEGLTFTGEDSPMAKQRGV
ncbi:hypothetical protein HALA3H3_340102 [Halomonas sp. A3H3]|uniref:hypothetical protein n=1 Tax=Halomonas sp. A3H3 TaxID=1346287 RepID=UPI00038C73F6|nr:hypothetical protein HALA3H3_340102 [Halomonas sp. A3H3]